jgi:uncharacterized membrane protein
MAIRKLGVALVCAAGGGMIGLGVRSAWADIPTHGRGCPRIEAIPQPATNAIFWDSRGISADGSVLTILTALRNEDTSYTYHSFAWNRRTGFTDLAPLPNYPNAFGQAISGDGRTIVGTNNTQDFSDLRGAFWNQDATGWRDALLLGPDVGDTVRSVGGVSLDGSAIAGSKLLPDGEGEGERAFRWTNAGGFEVIGMLAGDSYSQPDDISDDGAVVVGTSYGQATGRPFRWTSQGGIEELGALPAYPWITAPFAASADGSVIVGVAMNNDPPSAQAFRWTSQTGLVGVGALPGSTFSLLSDVSGDGSLAVGYVTLGWNQSAAVWTSDQGLVELSVYLTDLGVDLTGWALTTARAISSDATTITGSGTFEGRSASFVVTGLPCRFACPAVCDSLDFNNDTITPDSADLDDFIAVLSGGPAACSTFPSPGCNDLDFNNDGLVPDSGDLDAFIRRLGGGACAE